MIEKITMKEAEKLVERLKEIFNHDEKIKIRIEEYKDDGQIGRAGRFGYPEKNNGYEAYIGMKDLSENGEDKLFYADDIVHEYAHLAIGPIISIAPHTSEDEHNLIRQFKKLLEHKYDVFECNEDEFLKDLEKRFLKIMEKEDWGDKYIKIKGRECKTPEDYDLNFLI